MRFFNNPVFLTVILSLIIYVFVDLFATNYFKNVKIEELSKELQLAKSNNDVCKSKIDSQNAQILDMQIPKEVLKEQAKAKEKIIRKIDKIYIKDKTCQRELNAYKELFNASY
ncbi:MAG: hypothetical protein SPI03_03685 [Campylobacter sputorum]|uniref:hypothetical protein n=1 Tax=Campylobacter sputorum TaxID=206 RepID=UPI002A910B1D|nr:hypothetical protein [Campylobacter sputorum]MDY6120427.1 hypothetical protein [Campylobacter sputorum]